MKIDQQRKCSVCVTGAGGYIGSWLVKNLLHKGYTVHATLRDPGNEAKTGHLLSLPGAEERLKLFKADLSEEGSFDSAVQGCECVFNLATPLDYSKDPETGFIQPTVKGCLNVLKSCTKAKSVRRVVHTSSITAASPLNENGEFGDFLDESCWTPVDFIRSKRLPFWMYFVSKTLAEQEAIRYGKEEQIEVVTIAPALVAGPCLTPALPLSTEMTLALITGKVECYEMLKCLQSVLGSIPLVHIEDLCNAHILLMEQPSAYGRFICSSAAPTIGQMTELIGKRFPHFKLPFKFEDMESIENGVHVSSTKLLDIGFSYKYGVEHILKDSIDCAKKMCLIMHYDSM